MSLSYQKKAWLAPAHHAKPSLGMTPITELYSVVFIDYFIVDVIPNEGLAGLMPTKPSFSLTTAKKDLQTCFLVMRLIQYSGQFPGKLSPTAINSVACQPQPVPVN